MSIIGRIHYCQKKRGSFIDEGKRNPSHSWQHCDCNRAICVSLYMFIMTLMLCTTKIRSRERIWLLALYNTTLFFAFLQGIYRMEYKLMCFWCRLMTFRCVCQMGCWRMSNIFSFFGTIYMAILVNYKFSPVLEMNSGGRKATFRTGLGGWKLGGWNPLRTRARITWQDRHIFKY